MLLFLCAGACSSKAPPGGGAGSKALLHSQNRFPHELHAGDNDQIKSFKGRGLQCVDCHAWTEADSAESQRPGLAEHAPCDSCHAAEFFKPPGKFCKVCHKSVDVTGATPPEMRTFPSSSYQRVMAANFAHETHLDVDRMEKVVGFHVACADCHARDKEGEVALPSHPECGRCHDDKSARKPLMSECSQCHSEGQGKGPAQAIGRRLITEELKFSHSNHKLDGVGDTIACATCHTDAIHSQSVADMGLPQMQACAECHQDPRRTPEKVRIDRCEVCHKSMQRSQTPRTHLATRKLPETHSIDFRTNHEEQAASDNANCGFCHTGLSGKPRDSCFQCHDVMRPRDHMLGWRDESHGREAAMSRTRCATCHQADYCVACHSIPPRSHQPLVQYRNGGHARNAKFGLSTCMACHTFQDTCSRCHRGSP